MQPDAPMQRLLNAVPNSPSDLRDVERMFGLSRRPVKLLLAFYFAGFVICESLLLWGAYESGGLDRTHTLSDLTFIGAYILVSGLLWPALVVVLILQLLGLLRATQELW
jgi:hypothetical protein